MATNVTDSTFDTEVLQADKPVLVDFWAEWCGPCHAVEPVLQRIAEERDLKLVKVNIDENQDLAMRYGIQSIPNMMLFDGRSARRPRPSAPCRRACSSASSVSKAERARRHSPRSQRPTKIGELLGRLGRVVILDEAQEVRVLREIRLELSQTGAGPVLQPRLGDVVLDPVEAALAHCCA